MRILVDYRPAVRARTGVGEYMHEIVRAYTARFADPVSVFTSSWKDRPAPGLAGELRARVVDRRVPVRVLNDLWHRWEWPPVEWLAGPADVVHAAHPLLIPARRAAQVVTIHDLFFLTAPERTVREIRRDYPRLTRAHAQRADAIVTPSAYTKGLIERLDVPAERIHVCSLGAPAWRTLGREPNLPPGGCILFIGTLEPRKNLGVLLDAYERLLALDPSAPDLVFAGRAAADAEPWLQRLRRFPLAGRARHIGYIRDSEREGWYSRARALVLPSLDEGFGLPLLEAMAAGVPAVVSNQGALPEVAGGAAVLVDPTDAAAWTHALQQVLQDDARARTHAEAGLARAKDYTWERTATSLHAAYVDACARRAARAGS